jgi:hypothetical protein
MRPAVLGRAHRLPVLEVGVSAAVDYGPPDR